MKKMLNQAILGRNLFASIKELLCLTKGELKDLEGQL